MSFLSDIGLGGVDSALRGLDDGLHYIGREADDTVNGTLGWGTVLQMGMNMMGIPMPDLAEGLDITDEAAKAALGQGGSAAGMNGTGLSAGGSGWGSLGGSAPGFSTGAGGVGYSSLGGAAPGFAGSPSALASFGQGTSYLPTLFNGAVRGGINSGLSGGNIGKGMLGGMAGSGFSGNPADSLGIDDPFASKAIGGGINGFMGSLAQGRGLGDSIINGGVSGGLSGLGQTLNAGGKVNSWFKNDGIDSTVGSGGENPDQYSSDENSPNYKFSDTAVPNNDFNNTIMSTQAGQPSQNKRGIMDGDFSQYMPSEGFLGRLGDFASNHAGDIATGLYSLYNTNKMQNAMQARMNSLSDMYGQNSPYAQQLRDTMTRQAAARGQRANTGALEVALQSNLAQHAAGMAPAMMQYQNALNGMTMGKANTVRQLFEKGGGFGGLQSMWTGIPQATGKSGMYPNAGPSPELSSPMGVPSWLQGGGMGQATLDPWNSPYTQGNGFGSTSGFNVPKWNDWGTP